MASFHYRATNKRGEPANGFLEAVDRPSAIEVLRSQDLTLLDVRERSAGVSSWHQSGLGKAKRLPLRELCFIARQLENLLSAGCDLERSLVNVAELSESPKVKDTIARLTLKIRQGRGLADSMADEPGVFPPFFISLVRAGESAGSLESAFKRLAEILDRQLQAKGRIVSALIYPAIMLFATVASVVLIMTVVIPQFEPIFEQAGAELPFLTRLVVGISRLISEGAAVAVPLSVPAVLFAALLMRRPATRLRLHEFVLKVRLVGPTVLKAETARFAYVLGSLLQGGVPLTTSLTIAHDSVWNLRLRSAILGAREKVKDGVRISSALQSQKVFPTLLIQLVAVAEESAKLGPALLEVGRIYDSETETLIQRLIAVATPAATVLLGGLVGLILTAILLAVLKVNDLAL